MKEDIKRIIITLAVFAVIYLCSGLLIGAPGYDMYLEAIKVLTAVIGAGCYWVGSNKR